VRLFQSGTTEARDRIATQGFELTLTADGPDLARVAGVVVALPDGTTRELRHDHPTSPWALPMTHDGLPGRGDLGFTLTLSDGQTFTIVQPAADAIDIPRNISVTRVNNDLTLIWTAVEGARNYAAQLHEWRDGGLGRDAGVGCANGDPAGTDPSVQPRTICTIASPPLTFGTEYVVVLAAESYVSNAGQGTSASFSQNYSAPFPW
jgi:hypothetical protein